MALGSSFRIFISANNDELTDQKLCNNKFTWCFHKAKLVLYSPCKRTRNLFSVIVQGRGLSWLALKYAKKSGDF